jgi:hypothetical protein
MIWEPWSIYDERPLTRMFDCTRIKRFGTFFNKRRSGSQHTWYDGRVSGYLLQSSFLLTFVTDISADGLHKTRTCLCLRFPSGELLSVKDNERVPGKIRRNTNNKTTDNKTHEDGSHMLHGHVILIRRPSRKSILLWNPHYFLNSSRQITMQMCDNILISCQRARSHALLLMTKRLL